MATSAQDIIEMFLKPYGLDSLASWAWGEYLSSGLTSADSFTPILKAKLPQQQAFIDRFPAYNDMLKAGKGISIDQYVTYEKNISDAASLYGLPKSFVADRTYVADILKAGVSANEFAARAQIARDNSLLAPPETKQALQSLYGVTPGDLTAYWMDPDKALPILQQQATAAAVAGAGLANGVAVDRATAERIGAMGYSDAQVRSGFGSAAGQQALSTGNGETVSQQQLVDAQFGNVAAQQAVQRVQQGHVAQFQQGGGAQTVQSGVSGLGQSGTR